MGKRGVLVMKKKKFLAMLLSGCLMVSLLSGENDMAQPTGFLANRSRTTARYAQRLPVQSRVRGRA